MRAKSFRTAYPTPRAPSREQGFVLVTALMFLIVLTVLGLSIMSTNTLEERMAGYVRDRQLALEAAEATLRQAERDIFYGTRLSGTFAEGCSSEGLCLPRSTAGNDCENRPVWAELECINSGAGDSGWMTGAGSSKTIPYSDYLLQPSASTAPPVAKAPRYIIEELVVTATSTSIKTGFGPQNSSKVYRVSAVGFGRRVATRVVLQALYRP